MFGSHLIYTIGKAFWDRRGLWLIFILTWIYDIWLSPNIPQAEAIFMLFGLGLFVLPHAIPDLYLPAWILIPRWERRPNYWGVLLMIHVLVAASILGLWKLEPDFGLALFTALIMWHWGSMDTLDLYHFSKPSWIIGSVGRGILVVAAPLFFQPLETQNFIFSLLGLSHSKILTTLYMITPYLLALAVLLEVLAALVAKFIEGHGSSANLWGHLLESVAIVLTFAWVGPVIGLTLYFLIIHSLRHFQRLAHYIPAKRGNVTREINPIRNLGFLYEKTHRLVYTSLFLIACWLGWQLYQGKAFDEAALSCLIPPGLFMVTHTLTTLLTDFNPSKFEA